MKKVIGSEIDVYLRSSKFDTISDITGLLIDDDEDSIYVQGLNMEYPKLYIIPRDNIRYCTTSTMPSAELAMNLPEHPNIDKKPEHIVLKKEETNILEQQEAYLTVFINKEQVAHIPVPPTFNLSKWNDNILRVAMGNPDVRALLANKVQRTVEYWPGKVYIEVTEEFAEEQLEPNITDNDQNSFSMGGDITKQFLNPSQMILKLNSVATRGKKNGETKM